MSENETTDGLKQAMVQNLMGVIGAPDDESVAAAADSVVLALDARLREEYGAA
ncbi:hypothetical protein [Streptomyces odontomachi]|uniref:hypothetical protein n=1 Tax=Streptomyces odontomachi TaxID=2944940 RepID=UPI00210AB58C|nr:hypothetical protein [Streptomyces sp. ODS25]